MYARGSFSSNSAQLRHLFVTILIFCEPASPGLLWEQFSSVLSDDFFHAFKFTMENINDRRAMAMQEFLMCLDHMPQQHGRRLIEFDGLPDLDRSYVTVATNILLQEKKMFNIEQQV